VFAGWRAKQDSATVGNIINGKLAYINITCPHRIATPRSYHDNNSLFRTDKVRIPRIGEACYNNAVHSVSDMTAVDVNVSVVSSDGVSIGKQSADGAVTLPEMIWRR